MKRVQFILGPVGRWSAKQAVVLLGVCWLPAEGVRIWDARSGGVFFGWPFCKDLMYSAQG